MIMFALQIVTLLAVLFVAVVFIRADRKHETIATALHAEIAKLRAKLGIK